MKSQVGLRKHNYEKASIVEVMEFQLRHFKSCRMYCESAALSMSVSLENSAAATGLEKASFIPIPKKGNSKECSNYCPITLISHTSKLMLKILQTPAPTVNFQMFKLDLEKPEGPEIKLPTICWIAEK